MIWDDMINIFERQHESTFFLLLSKYNVPTYLTYLNKENKGVIKKIK